jgi:hypothetical protein
VAVGGPEIDAAALGEDVLSTWSDGGYRKLSGASMATPFIAGMCALCLAYDFDLHGEHARKIRSTHCMKHLLTRFSFNSVVEVGRGKGIADLARLWDVPQLFEYELDTIC